MLNYIRAELYRCRKSPSYIWTLIVTSFLIALYLFIIGRTDIMDFSSGMMTLKDFMKFPFIILVLFSNFSYSSSIATGSIKNELRLGLSREELIKGKLISQFLMGIEYLLVYYTVFLLANIFFLRPENMAVLLLEIRRSLILVISLIPIWMAGVSILQFINTKERSEFIKGFIYISILSLIPNLLAAIGLLSGSMGLAKLMEYIGIANLVEKVISSQAYLELLRPLRIISYTWLVGIIYIVVFSFLAIKRFEKIDL